MTTRSVQTLLQNKEHYLRLLRRSLLQREETVGQSGRRKLQRSVLLTAASYLALPDHWLRDAGEALAQACGDVVSAEELHSTDYFYCALIHPSFVPRQLQYRAPGGHTATSLRRQIAMPPELSVNGAAALHVFTELLRAHRDLTSLSAQEEGVGGVEEGIEDDAARDGTSVAGTAAASGDPRVGTSAAHTERRNKPLLWTAKPRPPQLDTHTITSLTSVLGVAPFVLYDKRAFAVSSGAEMDSEAPVAMPAEVRLSAAVALCGAVELQAGLHGLARFLDRAFRLA